MNQHTVVEAGKIPGARTALRSKNKSDAKRETITAHERECMIATAAYYRAERRGFAPGQELDDWIEAEMEIDQQMGAAE